MKLPSGTTIISGHVGQSRNTEPGFAPDFSEKAATDNAQQSTLAKRTVDIHNDNNGFIF